MKHLFKIVLGLVAIGAMAFGIFELLSRFSYDCCCCEEDEECCLDSEKNSCCHL